MADLSFTVLKNIHLFDMDSSYYGQQVKKFDDKEKWSTKRQRIKKT